MRIKISDLAVFRAGPPQIIDNGRRDENNTRLFWVPLAFWPSFPGPGTNGLHTVANIKSARKRARQSDNTRLHKMGLRSKMRTHIKAVIVAVEKGDKDAATAAYKTAVPIIDAMITKGVVNKNKAARHKSRLNKMVKALAA